MKKMRERKKKRKKMIETVHSVIVLPPPGIQCHFHGDVSFFVRNFLSLSLFPSQSLEILDERKREREREKRELIKTVTICVVGGGKV